MTRIKPHNILYIQYSSIILLLIILSFNTSISFILHKKNAKFKTNIRSTKSDTTLPIPISKSLETKINKLKQDDFPTFINNHIDKQLYFDSLVRQCIIENQWEEYLTLINVNDICNDELMYRCTLQACINTGYVIKAYELLQNTTTIQPTIEMYSMVITALCKERKIWKKSLSLLDHILSSASITNNEENRDKILKIYNTIISTCSITKQAKSAIQLLQSLEKSKILNPDIVSYNSVMNACIKTPPHYYKNALTIYDEICKDPNVKPDIITYTCAIRACTKAKLIKKALGLFEVAKDTLELDVHIYTAIIDACSKNGKYYSRKAIDLFHEMNSYDIQPNAITYSVLIGACGNSFQWELALDFFHEMKDNPRLKLDVIVYNNVISSLAKSSRNAIMNINTKPRFYIPPYKHQEYIYEQEKLIQVLCDKALYLLNDMKRNAIQPDIVTYTSIITTLSYGGKWKESLELLNNVIKTNKKQRDKKIRINKILYTSVLTACGRAGQWELAYDIFNQMEYHGKHLKPDRITYNSLLSALRISNQTNLVYETWEKMCNDTLLEPDIITITDVLTSLHQNDTLDKHEKIRKMDYVFEDAVQRGILLKETQQDGNTTSLDTFFDYDLSGMSFSVANTCIRYLLKNRIQNAYKNNTTLNDLQFITGVGYNNYHYYNTNDDTNTDDHPRVHYEKNYQGLKEYVQEILRNDYNPPLYSVVPYRAKGTVVIKKDVLKRWIDSQV